MLRFIIDDLKNWKASDTRKPLILHGARQVGKTYIIKQFGQDYYQNLAYFNFDHDDTLQSLFSDTKDPQRILEQLSLATGQKISPGNTLIFFDEIQECPDALNSLKYFYEEAPEHHIIAAGSLLGIRLSRTSFPVGKVNFLNLSPMSFSEFLIADGHQNLVDFMRSISEPEPVPSIFASQLSEKLRTYFIVGGMPEAVNAWVKTKDITKVTAVQSEILQSYERDFSKHTTVAKANKISLIWNGAVSQLARENKKFVYQVLKTGARAREYEDALNWLKDAGLIYKIYDTTKPALPLKAYEDLSAFKIYLLDTGLLCRMAGLDSSIVLKGDEMFGEFKGALAENYCLQMLKLSHPDVYYHTFDRHEVDYLLQVSNNIIPIEVKSGKSGTHASLTRYIEQNAPNLAVRLSTNNLKHDGKILNLPLYLAEYLDDMLKISLG